MKDSSAEKIFDITRRGYETVSSAFSATRRFSWDDCNPLLSFVKKGMSVLDAGCGNGRMADFLSKASIHYTGIDLNQDFIHSAQERYSGSFEFYRGDILSLDSISALSGRTFDVVCSIAVIHHLPSEKMRLKALAQMHHLLKSGGILFLTNWNLWRLAIQKKSVWKYAFERSLLDPRSYARNYGIDYRELSWRDLFTTWKSGKIQAPLYYYTFRCQELKRLCTQSGFVVQDCYYSLKGKHVHWWNGENICLVAKKEAP